MKEVYTPKKLFKHLIDIGLIYIPKPPKDFKEVPAYPIVKTVSDSNQELYENYKKEKEK